MTQPFVVEIDSFTDDSPEDFYGDLAAEGAVGVLVKVSQGDRWVLRDAPNKVQRATAAGLHVGALHYMEPGRATTDAERAQLVGNLPPGSYALGVVLELDDLGGRETYEMAAEMQHAIETLATAGYVVGVRATAELAQSLSANLKGARLWVDGEQLPGLPRPFATFAGRPSAGPLYGLATYDLVSARMLNAGDTGGRVVAEDDSGDPGAESEDVGAGPGSDGESDVPTTPEPVPGAPGQESGIPDQEDTEAEDEGSEDPGLAQARAHALASL